MKTISLKIDEDIFSETEEILSHIKKSRNRYINDAIQHYNKKLGRRILKKTLQKESLLIRNESSKVLKEFENLDDEL